MIARILKFALAFAIGWFVASCVFGATPQAKQLPLQAMPAPAAQADDGPTVFGDRSRGDKGLKPIDPPKFALPQPNVFNGWRIFLWGISIAGTLVGLFLAAVIVVFTLRFLRTTAVPAVTGVPATSLDVPLQLFDNLSQRIANRRKELAAETAELDKRIGKTKPRPKKKA